LIDDYNAKSKLFVECIENIIFNHSSESRFQYLSAVNQIPSDYMISESGKQTETSNGKKISVDSFKIKERVTEKSIKEESASTVGKGTTGGDDKTKDLDSAQGKKRDGSLRYTDQWQYRIG
jgi:hypothetical protein